MLPQPLPSPERRHSRQPPKIGPDPVLHLLGTMLDFDAPASKLEAANNEFVASLHSPLLSFPGTAQN